MKSFAFPMKGRTAQAALNTPGGPEAQQRVVVGLQLHLLVELRLARQAAHTPHTGRHRPVERNGQRSQCGFSPLE